MICSMGSYPVTDQSHYLDITATGVLSLIEDAGRQRCAHLGLTVGGVMDRHAWAWGNRLVGNRWGAAAVEITIGGLKGRFMQATQIALTGADLKARLNGQAIAPWQTQAVEAGDVLETGYATSGMRAYLCIRGGWKTPKGLGESRSCVLREQLGGLDGLGSALKSGDHLAYQPTQAEHRCALTSLPSQFIPDYSSPAQLDFYPNPHSQVSEDITEALLTSNWTLSSNSNRMAALLEGPKLETTARALISEGVAAGTVQLPPSGQPIILLNERQSIGGYPKPGFVTLRSLDHLAQVRPGQTVQLRSINLEQAQQQEAAFLRFFR
ncbi:biotin-dependent carboxyltransferase [Nitrincola iocasae]|uniref:Biotin-dependent carboxyltransferase n=1 Tax=Nitrincola iocasae TaxID=2614693 RepID=A0A5J6LAC1_9GAMM|nr:biotin-dependent carboxyltransferase [Nitrincola iocasae]